MLLLIFTPTCTFVLRDGGDTKSLFLHREDGVVGVLYMTVRGHLCPLTPKSINTGLLLKFKHLDFVTCGHKWVQAGAKGMSRHKWV